MTVKATLKTISTIDASIDQWAQDFDDRARAIGEAAFKTIQKPLLDELKFYPPPMPNQKYVRTYKLRAGWKAGIVKMGSGKFGLVISNATEYTAFVVGSLAQSKSAAASFQADIHKKRWPLATDTVTFWFEAYLEALEIGFADELSRFGTIRNQRRAFTGKTR